MTKSIRVIFYLMLLKNLHHVKIIQLRISSGNDNSPTEIINFRKFNATNMEKFENSISNESWEPVSIKNSADEKYEKFVDIYNKHYDKAFVLNTSRRKNERKILNLGYFLGWRMRVPAQIKHTTSKLPHQVARTV